MRETAFPALRRGRSFVFFCIFLMAQSVYALEPIAIDDLARTPALQSVSMSPDGKHLVALVPSPANNEETALATWDLDDLTGGPKVITPSGERMKFISAKALKAGRIMVASRQEFTGALAGCGEGNATGSTKTFVSKIYLTGNDQRKFSEAFSSNVRRVGVGEQTERCMEIAGTARMVHDLPLDPEKVIIEQLDESSFISNYFVYNLTTDKADLLFRGNMRSAPSLFDSRSGKVLVRTELESAGASGYRQKTLLLEPESGEYKEHKELATRLSDRHIMRVEGVDEATGKLYILTDMNSDKVQARLYDPKLHKFDSEPVLVNADFSIESLIFGSQPVNLNKVVGFFVDGPARQVVYVDSNLAAIQESLKRAFPGENITIGGYNNDFSRVLFTVASAQHPNGYYVLFDRERVVGLGSENPWVKSGVMGEQRWVSYTARDGQKIPAILDLPLGWKPGGKLLPAVIHPHGGPWSRDYLGWDRSGFVPLMTSRGYAVLRPQYRGSSGLGRQLWLAGDREWGQKMSDDNDDGAAWLVNENIVDKDRIAIFGYSYGGFAAAAAVVRKPSPYQCAISAAPVTNLAKLGVSWSDSRIQRILQGDTVKGMDPMKNTANAVLPVLLFVGDRDVRTPAFHARDFYESVKNIVPAKFSLIPDMPHSMPWYPRQQRQILTLIDEFLRRDCGMDGL